ncbi:MAG: cytochrome D1 domain-containing protein [Hyphomicrobiaceae bacterium]
MISRRAIVTAAPALLVATAAKPAALPQEHLATGGLGLIVERATGSLLLVDRVGREVITRIEGLGDLSHASMTFSPDERFAYVFGRDGGLTKVDLTAASVAKRIVQAGNSIGGAISDDGKLVAVSNYEPGGIRVFDAGSLEQVADIPAGSKTIGIADLPGRRFIWCLWEKGEAWMADLSGKEPVVTKVADVGKNPFDGVLTDDGNVYLVGLFGEKGVTAIDVWQKTPTAVRFLKDYGKTSDDLPVYKMPHLQGWAFTGNQFVLPAVGAHELLWVDRASLAEAGRTKTHGQAVFIIAQPGSPYVWVNYALPDNDTVEIVDSRTREVVASLKPGPAVLHMEFAPRGAEVWVSVRDADKVVIYDTRTLEPVKELTAKSPSGIFFTARAHRIGL